MHIYRLAIGQDFLSVQTHLDVKYPHFRCTNKEVAIVKFCLNHNISAVKNNTHYDLA